MPVGLEVRNDVGTFIVTSEHRNLQIKTKGTATLTLDFVGLERVIYTATITVTGCNIPFVAHRGSSLVGITSVFTGGSLTFKLWSPSPISVDWYVFDLMPSPASSGFGLQVFTAAGDLAFDAASGPLRIAGISQMPGAIGDVADLSVSYPAGRTYASIHSTSGNVTTSDGSPGNYVNRDVITMTSWSGTNLTGRFSRSAAPSTAITQNTSDEGPTNFFFNRPPAILVADVTNL